MQNSTVPIFMQPGSSGTGASGLQLALLIWYQVTIRMGGAEQFTAEEHEWFGQLQPDQDFNRVGPECLKIFQRHHHLDTDAGNGPDTRQCMLNLYNFDFDAWVTAAGGTTKFVQFNGSTEVFKDGQVQFTIPPTTTSSSADEFQSGKPYAAPDLS
jgi:hypothetical protein